MVLYRKPIYFYNKTRLYHRKLAREKVKRRNYDQNNLKCSFICLIILLSVLLLQAQDISKYLVLALTFDEAGSQTVADKSEQENDAKIDDKDGLV